MEFSVKKYGAVGDGKNDDAIYIQKAIDACHENGGGKVVCEAGTYLCSTIVLKSNVDFYLEPGCVINSSLERDHYKNGKEALIEAKDAENISISGFGIIDGRSQLIFYDDGQDPLHEAPLDYPNNTFRPKTSKFENVKNITIRDITIKNSVLWTLHFAGCEYVTVSGIKILNDIRSNENDGIDPDCCKNVIISDCIITAGDDPIVIKSTKEMAEKYGSCENIVVNNCLFKTKSAGLKIGTETWGDICNVMMSNCVMEECGRAVAIWARDGGMIENITVSNVRARCRAYNACTDNKHIGAGYPYWWGKGEAIYISNTPRNTENINSGSISKICLSDLYIESESCVFISGSEHGKVENIEIKNCQLTLRQIGSQKPGWFDYRPSPLEIIPHCIPGVFVENASKIVLRQLAVEFADRSEAWGEIVWLENSDNIFLDGITGNPAKEGMPVIFAKHTTQLESRNIRTDTEFLIKRI